MQLVFLANLSFFNTCRYQLLYVSALNTQTFSGVLWTISMIIAAGFVEREKGDILAACDFEVNIPAYMQVPNRAFAWLHVRFIFSGLKLTGR